MHVLLLELYRQAHGFTPVLPSRAVEGRSTSLQAAGVRQSGEQREGPILSPEDAPSPKVWEDELINDRNYFEQSRGAFLPRKSSTRWLPRRLPQIEEMFTVSAKPFRNAPFGLWCKLQRPATSASRPLSTAPHSSRQRLYTAVKYVATRLPILEALEKLLTHYFRIS